MVDDSVKPARKPPTEKQIAARKAFGEMVRKAAAERKAAKQAAPVDTPKRESAAPAASKSGGSIHADRPSEPVKVAPRAPRVKVPAKRPSGSDARESAPHTPNAEGAKPKRRFLLFG